MLPCMLTASRIAYEDDYLLIVDKPPGMLIHPTVSERGGTLYDCVAAYYRRRQMQAGIHPVSRLDRYTSGLVIFAKEPVIQNWLSRQKIHKEYLAVVAGHPSADSGVIEAPIARRPGSIIERCVSPAGKYACTAYRTLRRKNGRSLLQITLLTGRTHQIRVHLAYLGCPVFNDNLYGTPGPQSRHALHAWKLGFTHPVSDSPLEITRALPEDLRALIY